MAHPVPKLPRGLLAPVAPWVGALLVATVPLAELVQPRGGFLLLWVG